VKSRVLSFGSLSTPLARNQAQWVIDRLQEKQPRLTCQLNLLPSPVADRDRQDEPFVTACRAEVEFLEQTVLREEVRFVVLEASDMVVPLPEGLAVICVPDRQTPYDAFLNRQGLIMDEMEPGSRVGVLSLRSRTQMQALWPDLEFVILRGGVERAMEIHMRRSEIEGLVLPASVTEHLGIQGIVAEIFSPEFILPGPGQGIQVIVGHAADNEARELLADLHSTASAAELEAEHAFCRRMVSDQDLPVGALARVTGGQIAITGTSGSGTSRITVDGAISEAEAAGLGLAMQLLCSVESFVDLLEADFPDGLPEDDGAGESDLAMPGEDDDLDDLDDLPQFDDDEDDILLDDEDEFGLGFMEEEEDLDDAEDDDDLYDR
jgi:hydroxymethylbilane synthase